MTVEIDDSVLLPMYSWLMDLRKEQPNMEKLDQILKRNAYHIEFQRYGDRVSPNEFKEYLLKVFQINEDDLTNKDLRGHHKNYLQFFENPDQYLETIKKIPEVFTDDFIEKQFQIAKAGLPNDLKIGDITILFTFGIGISYGWPHVTERGDNYIHFDILQLVQNSSLEEIQAVLAHELHHIGINPIHDKLSLDDLPLEQLFLVYFSGEGLAVKYCNNAKGFLSEPIHPQQPMNIGLDKWTWNYLVNKFPIYFEKFTEHLHQIRTGEIATREDLMKIIQGYWMNSRIPDQSKDEPGKLKQLPLYEMGNDFWGVIHDAFGKEALYDLFNHLEDVIPTYNRAIEKLKKPTKFKIK